MLAWLHAVPKPPEGSRRAERATKTGQAPKHSRLDLMKKSGSDPQMPPNPAPHIIAWLVDMGITEPRGMGQAVLSWGEIDAWCRRTRLDIEPWVARLIRHLSNAYIAFGRQAESETCPPPWRARAAPPDRSGEQAALEAVLG